MDTFNFKRFWLTLKTLVVSERKRHIRTILISFVFIMCFFSIPPISVWNAGNFGDATYMYLTWYGFISFFFVIMLSVAPSLIMWGYDRKEQRITHFILPASRLEKFIALVCVSIVVNFACYFIGVLLADIMQWLILTVSGVDNPQLVMAEFFRNGSVFQVSGTYVSTVSAILFSVSILLCSMSIYLLGGVFFRRYSWLFTSMVLFFIFTSNPQPIGFSGILVAMRINSFYCTYFLKNRNVAETKSTYPITRLEVIRWFNQKSMVFNQSLS
ncbi:MAG: hypothetical protein IJ140_00005 [Prevotella sp.]|nr:hypothetical protein [Prevotella sp.]